MVELQLLWNRVVQFYYLLIGMDIPAASTNLYFKYKSVLHTLATVAWLTQTNKGDMVLPNSKWSCGPPAYQFLS
jgi:hypothetical protein